MVVELNGEPSWLCMSGLFVLRLSFDGVGLAMRLQCLGSICCFSQSGDVM